MKVTFVSNYLNHHQIPFSDALYSKLGDNYAFLQTMPMEQERVEMGWGIDEDAFPYLNLLYKDEEAARELIADSDVVIFGWSEREDLVRERLESGKVTLRVSERLYREGQWKAVSPRGLIAKYREHTKYRNRNVCLLCAGAYTASDFNIIKAYPGKMFKFGYFPKLRTYSKEEFNALKPLGERLDIVWAGRFIPLKHPEYMVMLSEALKKAGYPHMIHMAGSGDLEPRIKETVNKSGLAEYFEFHGYMKPDEVRDLMEKCHIHVFTSNYLEGWGAVVNEGMNSGCIEVVNAEVGAAPFLIKPGVNGLVYPDNSYDELEKLIKDIFENRDKYSNMGYEAYKTIRDVWNAEHAADEFLRFAGRLMEGEIAPAKYGPLSPAPVISPGRMYKMMMEDQI